MIKAVPVRERKKTQLMAVRSLGLGLFPKIPTAQTPKGGIMEEAQSKNLIQG